MSENVTRSLALTDSAMTRILSVMENNEDIGSKFRVYVTGGGCSGFKYNFSFDDKIEKDDVLFNKAVIDKQSLDIIAGSTVDFKKEMIGESFSIDNPKASASFGCGLSFSV